MANRFQEIVRLNAGNVLGAEDAGPARRWVSLIDQALNSTDEEAPASAAAYRLTASKQMVGVFLCVWVRAGLVPLVSDVKVSRVRRGVMGCTGNKVEFPAPFLPLLYAGNVFAEMFPKAGVDLDQHDAPEDDALLRLHPSGVRREGR